MSEKVYKSYRQQLSILRSRGMVNRKGSQGSRAMRILETENYYNVINGYKELFLATKATASTDEVYKTGTTFDEVYALYTFDREVRSIYMRYLLKLENTFKTVIAHDFSKKEFIPRVSRNFLFLELCELQMAHIHMEQMMPIQLQSCLHFY